MNIKMLADFRLKIFLEVARTGSFTRAAKNLDITQPAVSQSVNALEKELSCKLFTRSRGEISLTGTGMAFRQYAEKILYWYDAADRIFGDEGVLGGGKPIYISADPVILDYVLPGIMSGIMAAHPEIVFVSGYSTAADPAREGEKDKPFWQDPSLGDFLGPLRDENGAADLVISMRPSPVTMDFEREERLAGVVDAAVIASPLNKSVFSAAVGYDDGHPRMTESGSIVPVPKPFSTLAGIPVKNKFAVWDRYVPLLTPDLKARVAVSLSSVEAVKSIVSRSSSIVGIVPSPAVESQILSSPESMDMPSRDISNMFARLPVQLPDFAFDVHLTPRSDFAGKETCGMLAVALRDALKDWNGQFRP